MTEKTSLQNRLFHAQLADIARQVRFAGRRWRPESWKRLMIEAYCNAENDEARAEFLPLPFPDLVMLVEGVDGQSIVQLGTQQRRFTREQMAGLIESVYAFGAEQTPPVVWSDPKM